MGSGKLTALAALIEAVFLLYSHSRKQNFNIWGVWYLYDHYCYDQGEVMFKILVVEDDKDLNRSVCSFLNQSGYEAAGCLNASDANDAMYETIFDLIISDIMMPEIDGYEFARTVRSLNAEIPILFMTAKDDIGSMQRSYRIGIDEAAAFLTAAELGYIMN